jgi:hypothetical protein
VKWIWRVLGGIVSSLLHVFILTLVIFFWLRERLLKKQGIAGASAEMSGKFSYDTSGKTPDGGRMSMSDNVKESSSHE